MKSGMVDQKRKRTGELDNSGNNKPRVLLYASVLLFIIFLLGIFSTRIVYISSVRTNFTNIAQLKGWRNQRLDSLINLKKWIYELRPS